MREYWNLIASCYKLYFQGIKLLFLLIMFCISIKEKYKFNGCDFVYWTNTNPYWASPSSKPLIGAPVLLLLSFCYCILFCACILTMIAGYYSLATLLSASGPRPWLFAISPVNRHCVGPRRSVRPWFIGHSISFLLLDCLSLTRDTRHNAQDLVRTSLGAQVGGILSGRGK